MAETKELLNDYYAISEQIKLLKIKKQELRNILLGFLKEHKVKLIKELPYKAYYYELPRYQYDTQRVHSVLEPKGLFVGTAYINTKKFKELTTSDILNDEEVESLLNARTICSLSEAFYVRKV